MDDVVPATCASTGLASNRSREKRTMGRMNVGLIPLLLSRVDMDVRTAGDGHRELAVGVI
jgi:hypothetical protein